MVKIEHDKECLLNCFRSISCRPIFSSNDQNINVVFVSSCLPSYLFKVCSVPETNEERDAKISIVENVKNWQNYFCFWDRQQEQTANLLAVTFNLFPDFKNQQISKYYYYCTQSKGIDLYEVFFYKKFVISPEYCLLLIQHMALILSKLWNLNIYHDDVRCRNLVINLSQKEQEEKRLIDSLPILIDFEFAQHTISEIPCLFDFRDFVKEITLFFPEFEKDFKWAANIKSLFQQQTLQDVLAFFESSSFCR